MDQLVPYWDAINAQFQGPNNVVAGSVEIFKAVTTPSVEVLATTQATGASGTIPLGIAPRAGQITAAAVAAITPLTGNDTYTVDIRKNGTTVLTAAIALLSSTAARVAVAGTLASPPVYVAAGDFLEAVVTYTHGTGTAPLNTAITVTLNQDQGTGFTIPLGIASRAGLVKDVRIAAITPLTGAAAYTVDIYKNGATILTAPMALLVGTAARASIVGALAVTPTTVAAGDFFEAVFVSTPSTGVPPQTVEAQLQLVLN